GARLAQPHVVRRGARGDRRLVRGQRGLVARDPLGRLGRLLRAPVRTAAGRGTACAGARCDGRPDRGAELMRVAVTGAGGRLGRALVEALEEAPFTGPVGPIAWSRPEFDLDRPEAFAALVDR